MEKIVRADGEEVFEEDLFIDGTYYVPYPP